MENNRPLMVTIHCLAYNHEPYIRECLEGFVTQKTNFRFEAIVHDDVSTDNTASIIREYADKYSEIIKPIFETENQYSKRDDSLINTLLQNTHGKYVAFCEGDDYWIDPLKLQKQVELLENNQKMSLVYSKAHIRDDDKIYGDISSDRCTFLDLIKDNVIPTVTVMVNTKDYKEYINEVKPFSRDWMMGDYPLVLYFSIKSRICFLDDFTAVRRRLKESASSSRNLDYMLKFGSSVTEIRLFFIEHYYQGQDKEIVRDRVVKKDIEHKFGLNFNLGGSYQETKKIYKEIKDVFSLYQRIQYGLILNNAISFKFYRFYKSRK